MSGAPADPPTAPTPRLPRGFYRQDPITVARALLGQRLVGVRGGHRVAGTIVETEAYLGYRDAAAHSFQWRKTPRTQTMFADGGTAYVFLNYGIHHLLNVVVAKAEEPQAVLIRAVEPTEGLDVMRTRRPKARRDRDLCSGPGKVGAAFAVDRGDDGLDLTTSDTLWLERRRGDTPAPGSVVACPRIGVDYAGPWALTPLRYYLPESIHVSRRWPPAARGRKAGKGNKESKS